VSAQAEHSWHLNQQVWTSGISSTCTGAICPLPGPAAWNQGTVAATTQRYPMDFNVFTYLDATGLLDVGGPVAANGVGFTTNATTKFGTDGGIAAASFSINILDARLPIALVDGGGHLNLSVGGTLYGRAIAGPTAVVSVSPSVTFKGGATGVEQLATNPINFEMAFNKLQGMSSSLTGNPPTGSWGTRYNGTSLELTSTQPSANPQVFNLPSTAFTNKITSIALVGVPSSATVLINISGQDVAFGNAGIGGLPYAGRVLWNLPQATRLRITSVGMLGTILAPYADVQITNGFLTGSVVAWSMEGKYAEFHYLPFHNNVIVAGW